MNSPIDGPRRVRLGLCVFFNYPFPRNIPVWRDLYGGLFDEIVFIQPLQRSDDADVVTVYRAAFNFAGFFSDAREAIEAMDVDAVVFAGDDCILNPSLFGASFTERFQWGGDTAAFIPQLMPFARENWWRHRHRISVLGRFVGNYGVYDQRIEGWQRHLPDPGPMEERLERMGLANPFLQMPPEDERAGLTASQLEILRRVFQGRDQAAVPYPLLYAVSDFFIIAKRCLPEFFHQAGLLAAMNVFPEMAVPTALLSLDGEIRHAGPCGLRFQWTFGRNPDAEFFVPRTMEELRDCIATMEENTIFIHPVKLSSIQS